jgi:hypothetical protein
VEHAAGRGPGEPVRGLTIGEAAARLSREFPGLRPETLRAMERHGLLAPRRIPSGYRRYAERDLETARRILTAALPPAPAPVPEPRPAQPVRTSPRPSAPPAPRRPEPAPAATAEMSGASRANPPIPPKAAAAPPAAAAEAPAGRRRSPRWPEPEYFTPELGEVALGPEGLARAAGLEAHRVAELAGFGLISGLDPATGADLLVARAAADLLEHGIEPRHLRPVAVSAGRAAALLRAAGGGSARFGAAQAAAALVRLEAALLRAALLDD